ncbi:MAG: archease [Anaerolineae bacterium]|nr:archease [Anaerolineae bacterium]
MRDNKSGYLEMEHTADWALKVWAPDLAGLVEQAARGMGVLSGMVLEDSDQVERSISIHGNDSEQLMVNFLTEILYLGEDEGLGFDGFDIKIEDLHLSGIIKGANIASQEKEIKAVTYHALEIKISSQGLETMIVFDV